jgi:L-asparagine transporter-like permease
MATYVAEPDNDVAVSLVKYKPPDLPEWQLEDAKMCLVGSIVLIGILAFIAYCLAVWTVTPVAVLIFVGACIVASLVLNYYAGKYFGRSHSFVQNLREGSIIELHGDVEEQLLTQMNEARICRGKQEIFNETSGY